MSAAPDLDLPITERPTIPVPAPRESGVRLRVARVAYGFATVDVVIADLSRDPRSEGYAGPDEDWSSPGDAQNERPPSTSIVRALK
jgi:hypothetical protein